MNQEQVLEQCRKCGALLEGHFALSSGLHSDRYFQCALVLSDPLRAEGLARAAALRIEAAVDVVVGPALGAVVWAHELARALGVRALFTERVDGRMVLRRGFELAPEERVLVAEDVVTTGGSSREVIDLARRAGTEVVGVAAIVNRSGCSNPFEDLGLPLAALAEVEVETWEAGACPLCASNEAGPAVKPGSRTVGAQAGS
jgi:orotate phosphoribosyltransferase